MKKVILAATAVILTIPRASAQSSSWGATVEDAGKKVKIGGRIQAVVKNDAETESQDFYLRRLRVNLEYKPWENNKFVFDLRNDNADKNDRGDGEFEIGDGFWQIDVKNSSWVDYIRLFRSKVDISYSQTSSSKNLFTPDRFGITEYAADFVVHNRRAANAQINGHVGNVHYQAFVGDGVQSGDLTDLSGDGVDNVNHQKFSYGAKFRYFFMGDVKRDKVQETFYGNYDTFSLGLGYFANDNINVSYAGETKDLSFKRSMVNATLSYSYKNFRLLSEYFTFDGSIINLNAASKDDILGKSNGYYAQVEYVFGKVAPFVGYEYFNKWDEEDDYGQKTTAVGVNYYRFDSTERYGITYTKQENEQGLGGGDSEKLFAYIMLNF